MSYQPQIRRIFTILKKLLLPTSPLDHGDFSHVVPLHATQGDGYLVLLQLLLVDVCGKLAKDILNIITFHFNTCDFAQVNFLIYFTRNPRFRDAFQTLLRDLTPLYCQTMLHTASVHTSTSNSFAWQVEQLGRE